MEAKGTIKRVGEIVVKSDKFKMQELVLVTAEDYPQTIIFQFNNKNCSALDGIGEGQNATIHFNLRGREWVNPAGETKVFNTLEGWKITDIKGAIPKDVNIDTGSEFRIDSHDDLPF